MMLSLPNFARAQTFLFIKDKRVQRIKLLESTKKDVEKIFGKTLGFVEPIKVKGGVIIIEYSLGRCDESDVSDWDVPKDVVVNIDFNPSKEILVKSAKLNFDGYRLTFESMHNLPLYSYSNDIEGVKYVIEKGEIPNGIINSVEYYPSDKFKNLRCSQSVSPF
jgi:hypothetical protein